MSAIRVLVVEDEEMMVNIIKRVLIRKIANASTRSGSWRHCAVRRLIQHWPE